MNNNNATANSFKISVNVESQQHLTALLIDVASADSHWLLITDSEQDDSKLSVYKNLSAIEYDFYREACADHLIDEALVDVIDLTELSEMFDELTAVEIAEACIKYL